MNVILMRLRQMLRLAHERGYLGEDLSRWVILVRDRLPTIAPLIFDEKADFLLALSVRWSRYFEVALGTGLRFSEQIALTCE